MSTTKQLYDYKPYQVGTGRLDIATTISSSIRATGSLSFGFFKWPHDENEPVEKVVTYINDGDEEVILNLTANLADENGETAVDGMLALSEKSVTVPANGSADVTVTVNPGLGDAGTRYWGQINADLNGETVAHTAMGLVKEDEQYPLTLNVIDRDGSPDFAEVMLIGADGLAMPVSVEGSREVRLP